MSPFAEMVIPFMLADIISPSSLSRMRKAPFCRGSCRSVSARMAFGIPSVHLFLGLFPCQEDVVDVDDVVATLDALADVGTLIFAEMQIGPSVVFGADAPVRASLPFDVDDAEWIVGMFEVKDPYSVSIGDGKCFGIVFLEGFLHVFDFQRDPPVVNLFFPFA